jgi:hypothetical protein
MSEETLMQVNARFLTYALLGCALAASIAGGCGGSGSSGTTNGTSTTNTGGGSGHGGATTGTSSSGTGGKGTSSGTGGNGTSSGTGGNGTSSGTGGNGTSSGTGGASSTSSSGSTTSSSGSAACVPVACQGHFYQCGDCVDNDGDGKIDADDPDCLGPCDNTENNYYGGIPGQAGSACIVDCYFDQDSGSGNDDCHWNHKCDEHEAAPNYYPEAWNGNKCAYDANANTPGTSMSCDQMYTSQSQTCLDFCLPLTPNGCDCFGCCELPAGSGKFVWLGSEDGSGNGTCDLGSVGDPTKCEPCKPVMGCFNGCGHCEICIGKPTLPADCLPPFCGNGTCDTGETCGNCPNDCGMCPDGGSSSSSSSSSTSSSTSSTSSSTSSSGTSSSSTSSSSSSGGSQCPAGVQACGLAGQVACPAGYYCVTGCCQKIPG